MLRTEFDFTLPKGYVDDEGNVHKEGVMRLARAADELLPLSDVRVKTNQSYLIVVLLARVVRLSGVPETTPKVVENLFTEDLMFLHDLYRKINGLEEADAGVCPECGHQLAGERQQLGKA